MRFAQFKGYQVSLIGWTFIIPESKEVERDFILVSRHPESLWVGSSTYFGSHGQGVRDRRMILDKNRSPPGPPKLFLQISGYRDSFVKRLSFQLRRQADSSNVTAAIRVETQESRGRGDEAVLG